MDRTDLDDQLFDWFVAVRSLVGSVKCWQGEQLRWTEGAVGVACLSDRSGRAVRLQDHAGGADDISKTTATDRKVGQALETAVAATERKVIAKGSSASGDKMPFSDEELERIITACDNPPRLFSQRDRSAGQVGCEYKNDHGTGRWTGEDLKDVIELMLHTGFRISDATLFDMSRLQGNSVMIRARKNGNHAFAWVPDYMRDRLTRRAKLHGRRSFIVGRSERLKTVTNVWRRRVYAIGRAASRPRKRSLGRSRYSEFRRPTHSDRMTRRLRCP